MKKHLVAQLSLALFLLLYVYRFSGRLWKALLGCIIKHLSDVRKIQLHNIMLTVEGKRPFNYAKCVSTFPVKCLVLSWQNNP